MGTIQTLHSSLEQDPYSVALRIKLIDAYEAAQYPDLAAAEAYRAILLVDEVTDDSGEFHEDAFESARSEYLSRNPGAKENDKIENLISQYAQSEWLVNIYIKISRNLSRCGCLKSAYEYSARGTKSFPNSQALKAQHEQLLLEISRHSLSQGDKFDQVHIVVDELPDRGLVRRELYAWNDHEPDRFEKDAIDSLNEQMRHVAPKLEVRSTSLPVLEQDAASLSHSEFAKDRTSTVQQLGVFAKEDVRPGEIALDERSLLTAHGRLHDSFCDACSVSLSGPTNTKDQTYVSCSNCDDVYFCSQECLDLAQETYHPAICGTDVEVSAADANALESSDALYSLLLLRALAMAETQDISPLDLNEVKYIWGDYTNTMPGLQDFKDPPRTLPFSFKYNIFLPLHMLEKMDVNIFKTSAKYDFWVFNTLYAKFRGTASARQGPDGKPEIAAVHPLWCLANHSCDPNVTWDWRGSIKFTAKPERVLWKGKDTRQNPGLRKGEEVFSHYCDTDLSVKERREWAVGALGGLCMCERCKWEEQQ